jgi:predicted phage terminase large subunit-like protein
MSLTDAEEKELLFLLEEELKDKSRKSHLNFIEYCWMKSEPFTPGFHTKMICDRIDKAIEDFRNGKSSYLQVIVPFRHGKTDLLARYLPPHFLGEFPECEVMSTAFKADLSEKSTSDARDIFRSDKFKQLYPDVALSRESNAKSFWKLVDAKTQDPLFGKLFGSGLMSGITGSGGHLVLVDDPLSGRAAAESKTIRDKVWNAFAEDLFTRLAPVHIVILLATQWHWDDVHGRLENKVKTESKFPQFERLVFPAKASDYTGPGEYPGKYLFLERYPESWYESEYAMLGKYGSAALLDCNPMLRSGGILSTDGIVWHEPGDIAIPAEHEIQWARVWDLAHTAKQRNGDDPDYTSGTLMGFRNIPGDPIPHLWVKHVARIRMGAFKRDEFIKMHAMKDGRFVKQAIENSIESKDAYYYIVNAIPDYSFTEIPIKGDKLVRATPLEPIFEAQGHVHVLRGEWNDDWLDELLRFDGTGSSHDDQVDNLSAGYIFLHGNSNAPDATLARSMKARRKW